MTSTYDAYIKTTSHIAEISILARELWAASKGALTHREAIQRAKALLSSPMKEVAA